MSDVPFGFSNPDDDPDRKKDGGSGSGSSGSGSSGSGDTGGFPFGFGASGGDNPFGNQNPFGSQGFDPSQLGQMLSQFGQMLSGMGSAMGSGDTGPVNYDIAVKLARQQIGSVTPVSSKTAEAVRDATRLAELWLDAATTLPAGASKTVVWTPVEWLDNTLETWKRLCNPIAEQVNGMMVQGLPEEARAMVGPMMGMFAQMGGVAFGSQLGQALGQLSKEVLTSTDIGLPLGPEGTAALMPNAIEAFGDGLEQPAQEVMVFLAAREAAHQRLFSHVPWLRQRLLGTVEEYARGIKMDFSAIEDLAQGFDPSALSDPGKIQELLGQGAFEPQTTPEQKQALERLETLLALIEGWVETVVLDALGDRLPGVSALSETLRRRRATGGPAEQTFASLVGLELRPRKLREAAALWRTLTTDAGAEARDQVWAHPDLMPEAADLDSPDGFVARVLGTDTGAFDDPIAQLEAMMERERAEQEKAEREKKDDGTDGDPDESA